MNDAQRTVAAARPSAWTGRRGSKIAERLARTIVDEILAAELHPGDVLPSEAEMMTHYGVSRATLREALRLLEVQGLITMKPGPGGGPVLERLTPGDFARMAKLHLQMQGSTYGEILAARLAIEPLMARLAAETRDPEGLAGLQAATEVVRTVDLRDDEGFEAASVAFHSAVCRMSGNTVLNLLGEGLRHLYHNRVRTALTPLRTRAEVRSTHLAIADAIVAGRAAEAEQLMRDHMGAVARDTRPLRSILDEAIEWT